MDAKTENHPKIKTVTTKWTPARTLSVVWENGLAHDIYFEAFVDQHAAMAPIAQDPALFDGVAVGDWGWCAHWTDDIEVSRHTVGHGAVTGWRGLPLVAEEPQDESGRGGRRLGDQRPHDQVLRGRSARDPEDDQAGDGRL